MAEVKAASKGSIVLVTASPESVTEFSSEVEKLGFEVTVCKEANRALNIGDYKPKNWRPNLFIVDVIIPLMSGFEITRRILEKYPDGKVPVILMSPHVSPEDSHESYESGALAVIQKPICWDSVMGVLEKVKLKKLRAEIGEAAFKIDYSE